MTSKNKELNKNIELPIVISDHADWNELLNTIKDVSPNNVLVTHGREEGLLSYLMDNNINAMLNFSWI